MEMLYITLQAALGEASHFNVSTPFHATMYTLMGGGAVILVAICLWMGAVILRVHGIANTSALAAGLGLVAALSRATGEVSAPGAAWILTVGIGAVMIAVGSATPPAFRARRGCFTSSWCSPSSCT